MWYGTGAEAIGDDGFTHLCSKPGSRKWNMSCNIFVLQDRATFLQDRACKILARFLQDHARYILLASKTVQGFLQDSGKTVQGFLQDLARPCKIQF